MIPRRRYNVSLIDLLGLFSCGNNLTKLQKELELRFPHHHILLTGSGRDALLRGLELIKTEKKEILASSLNLKELMPSIEKKGFKIRYVDVNKSYTIDPTNLKDSISEDSGVVLVTHLFGVPSKMNEIMDIAKRNKLYVIEDCAHVFGITYNGNEIGTIGDIGFFSFESNKPINGYGGGLLIYRKDIFNKVDANTYFSNTFKEKVYNIKGVFKRMLEEYLVRSPLYAIAHKILFNRNFRSKFENYYRSSNKKVRKKTISDFQAKIILKNLDSLDKRQHKEKVKEYAFRKINKHIILQKSKQEYSGFYSVIGVLPEYDEFGVLCFSEYMAQRGFDVGVYSEVIDLCETTDNSKKIYDKIVLLPIHDGISFQEIRRLGECINEYYSKII